MSSKLTIKCWILTLRMLLILLISTSVYLTYREEVHLLIDELEENL